MKSNMGRFLLKRVDLVIVWVVYTLLVETIPTRFSWLTCRNEKLVQNKPLLQRLFDLILGFGESLGHIIFWKTVTKTFRSTYVNCFISLRSVQNCRKCTFLGNLRTITQEGTMEARQMTPFFFYRFGQPIIFFWEVDTSRLL